ncbi:MAG: DUF58 domain-containing protein [Candidatus Altiarchaeota archaeon]
MQFLSINELMTEVDVNVRRLIDTFRFSLRYKIMLHGSGMEFSELREYVPGEDDPKKIDWKASLRSNRTYVKEYEEERNLDVFIMLDTSSSMLFGTQDKLKSEYAAILAGTLAYAGIESGDSVGFCMFNDRVLNYIPPSNDNSTYYNLLRLTVNPSFYGGGCDLTSALIKTLHMLRPRTILFIISDFIGVGDGWGSALKSVSGKLDRVFGIMVRDIRDSVIPPKLGYMKLSDPLTGKSMLVNTDRLRKSFEEKTKEQEAKILDEFHSSGAHFVKIYTHQPFIEPLIRYLDLET